MRLWTRCEHTKFIDEKSWIKNLGKAKCAGSMWNTLSTAFHISNFSLNFSVTVSMINSDLFTASFKSMVKFSLANTEAGCSSALFGSPYMIDLEFTCLAFGTDCRN